MSDNLMDKVSAFGERLKIGGAEVAQKMTAGMTSVSFKVRELFQGPTQADKLAEEATAETLDHPDWALNLELCDMVNSDAISCVDLIRAVKKRVVVRGSPRPRVQYLALLLLETIVNNCEKAFAEVASECVLDEMVKLVDDSQTVANNRDKALMLIEAWGESRDELRYLPVYEETYKKLKSSGVRFPGRDSESLVPIFTPSRSADASEQNASIDEQNQRDGVPIQSFSAEQTKEAFDVARNSIELLSTVLASLPQQDVLKDDLTTTLVQQCHQSQYIVQKIIETSGDNEALLFESLNVNDEIQKALSKYEDLKKPSVAQPPELEPAKIPATVEPEESPRGGSEDTLIRKPVGAAGEAQRGTRDEMMDDLDEMIFGKKPEGSSEQGKDSKDLISL